MSVLIVLINICLVFVYKLRSLNNENMITPSNNEKFSVSKECISQKSFLPVDIDSDMIKLFPTLDFSTEHKSNE